jgi:pimeloyl-ACP methyl ester carboxylesterase
MEAAERKAGGWSRQRVVSADGPSTELWVDGATTLPADAPIFWLQPHLAWSADRYRGLEEAGQRTGFRVAVADLRGQGSSDVSARRGDYGIREMVEFDLLAQRDALAEAYPHAPVILAGHGFGGQLSVLYAARHPTAVRGVVSLAGGVFRRPRSRGWWFRRWGWGRDPDVPSSAGVRRDLWRQYRSGIIRSRGMVYDVDLRRARTPALFVSLPDPVAWSGTEALHDLAGRIPSRYRTHLAWVEDWVAAPGPLLEAIRRWSFE